jgi:hypothetical protein
VQAFPAVTEAFARAMEIPPHLDTAEAFRGLAKVMRVVGAVLAVLGVGTVVMTAGFVL